MLFDTITPKEKSQAFQSLKAVFLHRLKYFFLYNKPRPFIMCILIPRRPWHVRQKYRPQVGTQTVCLTVTIFCSVLDTSLQRHGGLFFPLHAFCLVFNGIIHVTLNSD